MLRGGAFQVWRDVAKTGNEKWDKNSISNSQLNKFRFFIFLLFPVFVLRSPFPASLARPLTHDASFGSQTCLHSFAFLD